MVSPTTVVVSMVEAGSKDRFSGWTVTVVSLTVPAAVPGGAVTVTVMVVEVFLVKVKVSVLTLLTNPAESSRVTVKVIEATGEMLLVTW
jgi:hypothetical protein